MAEDNKLGWFDPSELCWHCLLVKGENSKDGILVDMEGYHYARYAAFVPDCGRLRLQDVPCRCTGEQGQAREARKQAHANRGEHFASFEGYMLPGTNYTLHFLKYDKGQDLFTVRRQGGPNQFVDFTGSPETVAREFYFREGLLKPSRCAFFMPVTSHRLEEPQGQGCSGDMPDCVLTAGRCAGLRGSGRCTTVICTSWAHCLASQNTKAMLCGRISAGWINISSKCVSLRSTALIAGYSLQNTASRCWMRSRR